MKPRLKKTLKRAAIVTTGVFAFVGTVIGGYLVTPNRTKYIDVSVDEVEPTAFSKFVERITRDIGLSEEDEVTAPKYLHAEFDDFDFKYKMPNQMTENTIDIDGCFDFRMSSLSLTGIDFNVDAVATYNSKQLPLTLGHFKNDIYFGLKDMKIKFTEFSEEKFENEYWYAFARYANLDSARLLAGLGDFIENKFGGVFDNLINGSSEEAEPEEPETPTAEPAGTEEATGGFDFMSLIANGPKEDQTENGWMFTLGGEEEDICIKLYTDNEFSLTRVDLGTLSFGDMTIAGAIDVTLENYDEFVSPAENEQYIEVFNYCGITNKLISLLSEDHEDGEHQRFGVEFALDLDNQVKPTLEEPTPDPLDIARVEGSVNIDFDALLDLSQYEIPMVTKNALRNPQVQEEESQKISESELYQKITEAGFNLSVDLIGQNDMKYANFDLVFAGGQGYIRFNEQNDSAVMKLSIDTQTMNWVVDKVPELIESLSNDEETDTLETLSKFLTQELIDDIKEGDFSFILDMLDRLENSIEGFKLGIDLSQLGVGDNAYLSVDIINDTNVGNVNNIILDSTMTAEEKFDALDAMDGLGNNSGFHIGVNNIMFGDFILNADVNNASYADPDIDLEHDAENYQSVKFLPDVIDQVTNLTKTKKTGFELEGSVLDGNDLGISFSGEGQLDNNDEVKEGFGDLTIKQYKYHKNDIWATHKIAIDVTNLASNVIKTYDEDGKLLTQNNTNRALFVYGDPTSSKNIKGQIRLQTFSDILDIIKTFVNDFGNDEKFTKFLAPISKLLGLGALGDIIEAKDYVHLTSNELLKEVSVIDNGGGLRIVVSHILLGLPDDVTIEILFNGNNETGNQTLKSLKIKDLKLSKDDNPKKLNFTFTLKDYDESAHTQIDKGADFMDLNGIKTLLDLGINTTKANFYHLTASANVGIPVFPIALEGINFYVYVDGKTAKVYGKVDSVPLSGLYTDDILITTGKTQSSEMTFETYADGDDKVGGMFNIHREIFKETSEKVNYGSFWRPDYYRKYYREGDAYHYRSDSKNFMDNIAVYLLHGLLGVKKSYVSDIGADSTSSSSETAAGDFTNTFTSTGFQCNPTDSGYQIKVGINLNELTGISVLKSVEATIDSKHVAYPNSTTGIDVLGSLSATLIVKFGIQIDVSFSATVDECEFDKTLSEQRWNAVGQGRLEELSGSINGNAISKGSSYYNNPTNPYKYSFKEFLYEKSVGIFG